MSLSAVKPSISLFYPVYNDEGTVRRVTEKAIRVLSRIAREHEIIIVDDGSPDHSGEIADELARQHPQVTVIHHERHRGYGAALRTGFARCHHEWICFTDGDDQYDVAELTHMLKLLARYDMLITFRYCKIYNSWRLFVSWGYNHVLRLMFRSPFRDISCGLKLIRHDVLQEITITSDSPFVGAEIVLNAMLKGYAIGEVGISTYPRDFGQSTATSWANIVATTKDMLRIHREIFRNRQRPALPP